MNKKPRGENKTFNMSNIEGLFDRFQACIQTGGCIMGAIMTGVLGYYFIPQLRGSASGALFLTVASFFGHIFGQFVGSSMGWKEMTNTAH